VIGYLGLGSNVGERREHLQAAVDYLNAGGVPVLAASSVYETAPVGAVLDQRAFFNACIRIDTEFHPEELLEICKAAEHDRGRVLAGDAGYVRHGPRPLDVDLLLLGDLEYTSERLTLPHREVTTRRFVLAPLLELDPDLVVPGRGPAAPFLAALGSDQTAEVAGPPLTV
jgi:2-amino-4-hydroxy-6-hydroxymethyldihydropteridine diphosphokinase